MIQRELAGQQYYCLVAMKTVSQQFISEVAERAYCCFDLMLMLRAMIDECPELALDGASPPNAAAVEQATKRYRPGLVRVGKWLFR
jgi:hypothetical protein